MKIDSVEKFYLKDADTGRGLSLDREWMKTWPCKSNYTNTGKYNNSISLNIKQSGLLKLDNDRVLASSWFSKIIVKTSSNKHRLLVVDMDTGNTLYQIPIDMFVDHILLYDGFIVLLNANNLLLSVVLDFN